MMAASKRGKITELYDMAAIEAQQTKVIGLLGDLVKTINDVKPISVKLEGAEKTKDVIDGVKNLSQATAQVADTSKTAVNEMGKLVDMAGKASKANGDLGNSYQNLIRLSTQNAIATKELAAERKKIDASYKDGKITLEQYTDQLSQVKAKELEISVASQEVTRALRNTEKGFQSAEGSLNALRSELNLSLQAFDKMSEAEKQSDVGKELGQHITDLTDKISKQEQATGRFSRNVGNYSGALGTLEKAFTDVKTKIDQMNQSGNVNEGVMASLQKEYSLLKGVVDNQAAGFVSMRQEIQANEKAIEQLILVYGEDSAIVKKLIAENGDLRDSFDDLKKTQKTVGSDTFAFDALLQGGQALVGMYSAAQGAAALFGAENEDLQKTMVKLQASMALVQGVQAVVNALQKEGALIQGLYAIRTFATTVAMRVYTFATGGATVAARAFNTALLATGIGAALILISTAASAMGVFSDNTTDASVSLEDFNKNLEHSNDLLNDFKEGLDFDTKIAIEKLKQRGATSKQITDAEIEGIRKRIAANKDEIKDLDDRNAAVKSSDEDHIKKREAIYAQQDKLIKENSKLEGEIILKGEEEKTKTYEEAHKKRGDIDKKAEEERSQIAERNLKAQFELLKLYKEREIELYKQTVDDSGEDYAKRLFATTQFIQSSQQLAKANAEFELRNKKLTADERKLIEEKALLEQVRIAEEGLKTFERIENDRLEAVKKRTSSTVDEESTMYKALMDKAKQYTDQWKKDEKDKEEADKKEEERIKKRTELFKDLGKELEGLAFDLLASSIENEKNSIQDQIDLLEKKKQKDIEVANQTIVNAQDRANAITVIEARAAAEREQLEARQRKLNEQKAKFDRAKNIVDVIQNTTVAIIKTLAEYPGPPGIALAAIIGAIGAVQLARIIATPIPKYKHGTADHKGGLAVVGDGGVTEYAVTPEGKIYETPDQATVVDLPVHTKVFKDEFALMNAMHRSFQNSTERLTGSPNDHYQFQNMTAELGGKLDKVVKTIEKIPQPVFDKNGLRKWVHGSGSVTDYL
jgi:hypothetical protein